MKLINTIIFLTKTFVILSLLILPLHAQSWTNKQLTDSLTQYINGGKNHSELSENHLLQLANQARDNNWEYTLVNIEVNRLRILNKLNKVNEIDILANEILPIAIKLNLKDEVVIIKLFQIVNKFLKEDLSTIEEISPSTVEYIENKPKSEEKFVMQTLLFDYYFYNREITQALVNSANLLEQYSENDNHRHLILNMIAEVYSEIGDFEKAIKLYTEAINIAEDLNDYRSAKEYMHNYLYTLYDDNKITEIEQNIPLWEKFIELSDDIFSKASLLRLRGRLQIKNGSYDSAIELLSQSIALFKKDQYLDFEMLSGIDLLQAYNNKGDIETGLSWANKIESSVNSLGYPRHKHFFYTILKDIYLKLDNYEMAFYAIEKEIKYNVENLNSLRLIGVQTVEFKKTQGNDRRRLATLIAKNKIQELSIEKQRLNEMIYTLGIAIISLVLIISATMIRRLFKEKKRLSNLANTDHLTKALNRRAIMNLGVVELSRCHNENQPFTVAVADIDFFKNINDTFGHDTGDEVLKYFALCSKNIIRNTEYFGRIGGEEWLFIMPNSGKELATTLFKRLSSALANINDIINIGDNPLTFSLGIAEACANENLKDIVIRADEKLYLAKNNGRNQAMY